MGGAAPRASARKIGDDGARMCRVKVRGGRRKRDNISSGGRGQVLKGEGVAKNAWFWNERVYFCGGVQSEQRCGCMLWRRRSSHRADSHFHGFRFRISVVKVEWDLVLARGDRSSR